MKKNKKLTPVFEIDLDTLEENIWYEQLCFFKKKNNKIIVGEISLRGELNEKYIYQFEYN